MRAFEECYWDSWMDCYCDCYTEWRQVYECDKVGGRQHCEHGCDSGTGCAAASCSRICLLSHAAQLELTNGGPCARRQCYQPSPSQMCGSYGSWSTAAVSSYPERPQQSLTQLCPTQASQVSFMDLMPNTQRVSNLLTTVES